MSKKKSPAVTTLKGNITLKIEDLIMLQEGVIRKYGLDTGLQIDEVTKQFNSNFKNEFYQKFIKYLADNDFNLDISQENPKALSEIFYFTKAVRNNGFGSFRKQLINTLSLYAFNEEIGVRIITQEGTLINKLVGYWECYYDKDGTFKNSLAKDGRAELGHIAVKITGESINTAVVQYFQNKSWGSGGLKVFGPNFVFSLVSEKNNEPTMQIMNCGRNIEEFTDHVREAAGMFLHINEKGSPKYGKCIMLHFNNEETQKMYGLEMDHIELNSSSFFHVFKSTIEINAAETEKITERIKQFFSRGLQNTSDVHINDFSGVD